MLTNLKIPLNKVEDQCGYFSEKKACNYITDWKFFKFVNKNSEDEFSEYEWFGYLLDKGYRRSGNIMYTTNCQNCSQCTPIRLKPELFTPSKSQRKVWRINSDLKVVIEENPDNFVTDKKIQLYSDYDFYHNGGPEGSKPGVHLSYEEAKEQLSYMNSNYSGILNMEYYLNDQLIGVCVLDYACDHSGAWTALSSNYFYYDVSPEVMKRSLGVYSILQEIRLCQEKNIEFYYLGLYLPDCRKMNYKTKYKPYQLLVEGKWYDNPSCPEECIDRENILMLPYPGDIFDDDEICFISDKIRPQVLYSAYMKGIFPWFNEDEGDPVVWHFPKKRFVLKPEELHIPRSLIKFLKKNPFTFTIDTCFEDVIKACAEQERAGQDGTWIGNKIIKAYTGLHKAGIAHSFEVWKDGQLAGGFYGVLLGSVFYGESMFTKESNSSKAAFVLFCRWFCRNKGGLIDCQAHTENMERYGAKEIPSEEFRDQLMIELANPSPDLKQLDFEKEIELLVNGRKDDGQTTD